MTEADHQRLSEPNMRTYCEVLAETGSHKFASEAIACSVNTTCKWRARSKANPCPEKFMILPDPLGDPDEVATPFHQAVDDAFRAWCEGKLRLVLIQRATGYGERVVYQGREVWAQDTSGGADTMRVDAITGMPYWPPRYDDLGQPVPLVINKVSDTILAQVSKANLSEYKDKVELDVTSGGKPIFFPAKATSEEAYNLANGAKTVQAAKPDAG